MSMYRGRRIASSPKYIVVCKDNGFYVLATHRTFHTYTDAENYKLSVAVAREPIVVCID